MQKIKVIFLFSACLFLFSRKVIAQSSINYVLKPFNYDVSQAEKYLAPKISRPMTPKQYFFEYVNERAHAEDQKYKAAKRIEILYELGNSAKINGNYLNLEQLVNWWQSERPGEYEFWRYELQDSWEASFVEYYLNNLSSIEKTAEYEKTESDLFKSLTDIYSVIIQQQDKIDYRIGSLQKKPEEKKYLLKLSKNIFDTLFSKINSYFPEKDGNTLVSLKPLKAVGNFGSYFLWVDFLSPLNETVKISIKYDDLLLENTGNKGDKNIYVGELTTKSENEWLKVNIKNVSIGGSTDLNWNIFLKTNNSGVTGKPEAKKVNKNGNYLIYLLLIPLLVLLVFKRVWTIKLLRFLTPLLIVLYIFSIFLAQNNLDLMIIRSFLFWITLVLIWNIHESISFFWAFVLLLICPYLIARKNNEDLAETFAIISYLLLVVGTIKIFLGDYLYKIKAFSVQESIKNIAYFITWALFGFISYKLLILYRNETYFYYQYYGKFFLNEILKRFIPVIPLLIIFCFVFFIFAVIFVKKSKMFDKFDNLKKTLLIYLLLLFIMLFYWQSSRYVINFKKILLLNKPVIENISPNPAYIDDTVTIIGKNFLDQSKKGKVILNGNEQTITSWDNETIIFRLNEGTAMSGIIYVENQYNGQWINSNQSDFIIEGLTNPANNSSNK